MTEKEKLFEEFIRLKKREQEIFKSLSLEDAIDLGFKLTERGIPLWRGAGL